jgi:AcrR family transcriptional regulator
MRDISEEAKLNKALLFYYFNSKENLYREIIKHFFDDFHSKIVRERDEIMKYESIEERLRKIITVYAQHFANTKNIVHAIVHEITRPNSELLKFVSESLGKLRQPLVGILEEGMISGELKKIDPNFTAIAILGILNIMYRMPGCAEIKFSDEALLDNILNFSLNGILARE